MLRRIQRSIFRDLRRRVALLLVAACVTFVAACHKRSANSNPATPVVSVAPQTSYPMPPAKSNRSDLGWTLGSEQHVRLSDYQNKVLILDFYATWCEPCRESVPNLIRLQKRYGPRGLQVIGLNVGGPGDPEQVPAFARELHIQYQLGVPDSELAAFYTGQDDSIPQTVVLDRKGRLVKRFVGYDESVDQQLDEIVQTSLAEKGGDRAP